MGKLPDFDIAPLESFDAKAFADSDVMVQRVCDFVLTLAVIWNDYKNLAWAKINLYPHEQKGANESPAWSQFISFDFYLFRLICGIEIELFRLIKDSHTEIKHPLFNKVLKSLDSEAQSLWHDLVSLSENRRTKKSILNAFNDIRDQFVFHYKPKRIREGYKRHFIDDVWKLEARPLISRGKWSAARFHFADAAIITHMNTESLKDSANRREFDAVLKDLHALLQVIVEHFVQVRGFGWRKECE
jgi:hypothetical protein